MGRRKQRHTARSRVSKTDHAVAKDLTAADSDDGTGAGADVIELRPGLQGILKAKILGDNGTDIGIERSNLTDLHTDMDKIFGSSNAIDPPLDPLALVRLSSMSSALIPLVQAMAQNVHGHGYRLEPLIDLSSAAAHDTVKEAILLELEWKAEAEAAALDKDPDPIEDPTDDEVKERIKQLKAQMRREKAKAKAFFRNCSQDVSFTRLGRQVQTDLETTGFGAIEVRRNGRGDPSRLAHGQSWTFRALHRGAMREVKVREQATDISFRDVTDYRAFRRFVQVYEGATTYFKEFGDERVMSADTGRFYKDEKALRADRGENKDNARLATEILWFNLDSPESDVYGMIKWAGALPGVVGNREQAEVNLLFWSNKAIPPMVVMVHGGHLKKGAKDRLEEILEHEIKGVSNFHKVLILESAPAGGAAAAAMTGQDKVKIEIKPLISAIWQKPIWQEYAEANTNEVGRCFRMPPIARGDTKDLNRATAAIAERILEQQVYQPARRDFEHPINLKLMPALGVSLWVFRLNAPEQSEDSALVDFVKSLVESVLKVNEARRLVGQSVFGTDLPDIDAPWAEMPLRLAVAGFTPERTEDLTAGPDDDDPRSDGLPPKPGDDQQQAPAKKTDQVPDDGLDTLTITVDDATMASLVEAGA